MNKKELLFLVSSILIVLLLFLVVGIFFVFSGSFALPQYFFIGSISVHYYGITMALAVGAGWWLASKRAPKYGIDTAKIDTFLLWLAFGGFVGARAYHVASSWRYYLEAPFDALKVWHGGLSIFGALIGGFIVIVFFGKKLLTDKQFSNRNASYLPPSTLRLLDWLAPSVVLGQIIGRFGNFFNYEAFGYPSNLPWHMFVPEQFRPDGLLGFAFFHPLFLYEALGNACILYVLLKLGAKPSTRIARPGWLFFLYLFLYNAMRFALEFLRTDSTFLWAGVRLNVLVSAGLCLTAFIGLLVLNSYDKATEQIK